MARRGDHRRALVLVADHAGDDRDERPAPQRLRHDGDRRQPKQPDGRGHRVRRRLGPGRVGQEHLAGLLDGPEEVAGVHLVDRVEAELEGRHGAEVAAPAAERPEQLGVAVAVDPPVLAVGAHQFDRQHAVGREAVAASQQAHSAAQRVADHADAAARAPQAGQPELGGRPGDVRPQGAGLDAGDPAPGVDLHARQRRRVDQDRSLQVPARAVPGALHAHVEPVVAGEPHRRDDVVGARRHGDHLGALVDGHVPRHPRRVPLRLGPRQHEPRVSAPERVDVDRGRCGVGGHGLSPRVAVGASPRSRSGPPPASGASPVSSTDPLRTHPYVSDSSSRARFPRDAIPASGTPWPGGTRRSSG